MFQGLSLEQLGAEIDRRTNAAKDFRLSTTLLTSTTDVLENPRGGPRPWARRSGAQKRVVPRLGGVTRLNFDGLEEPVVVTDHTHGQIAARLQHGMKGTKHWKSYYDWLRAHDPALFDTTLNTLFGRLKEKRMVRTLDGNARAYLSDRYRIFDNWQVIQAVMPVLNEVPDMRIESCDVTDRRLYLKALFPRIEGDIAVGEPVQSGVCISNCEIGQGRTVVELLVYKLSCKNGLISRDYSAGRHHVGRLAEGGDDETVYELYRDETLAADDQAFSLKLQDTVRAAVDQTKFDLIVNRMREAEGEELDGDEADVVEQVAQTHGLREAERKSVLKHLLQSNRSTRMGLVDAVTRASQDVGDYDRATELERIGGMILAAPNN